MQSWAVYPSTFFYNNYFDFNIQKITKFYVCVWLALSQGVLYMQLILHLTYWVLNYCKVSQWLVNLLSFELLQSFSVAVAVPPDPNSYCYWNPLQKILPYVGNSCRPIRWHRTSDLSPCTWQEISIFWDVVPIAWKTFCEHLIASVYPKLRCMWYNHELLLIINERTKVQILSVSF